MVGVGEAAPDDEGEAEEEAGGPDEGRTVEDVVGEPDESGEPDDDKLGSLEEEKEEEGTTYELDVVGVGATDVVGELLLAESERV